MDHRAIAALLTKVAGLVLLIYSLVLVPDRLVRFLTFQDADWFSFLGTIVLPTAVPLLAGAVLVWLPATATQIIVGRAPPPTRDEIRDLWTLVVAGIGSFVFVRALLDLAYYAFLWREVGALLLEDPLQAAMFYVTWIEVAVGLALVLGCRVLSRLLRRVRYGAR